MDENPIEVGAVTVFRKTITETDMVLFSGITGDFAANHTDEEYMNSSVYGTRHIHGALVVGFMSTAAGRALENARPQGLVPVSLGYDHIRFIKPVFPGQTLHVHHEFESYDPVGWRASAKVEARVDGDLVALATHIVKWVASGESAQRPRTRP